MNKSVFTIATISLLIIVLLPTLSYSKITCNKDDEKVLFQIKKSLGNPYMLNTWEKTVDCCKWFFLDCDTKTGRIVSLTIFQGTISSQIPKQVGDLPFLKELAFRKLSNLTGEIPIVITKLTHLTSLTLSWTNLSGPVPSFLSQLKNLDFLDLSFNDLTGSIPPELATLKNLNALFLDRNKLTGVIPDSFGAFAGTVPLLRLGHNQLTGTIPKSLGYLNFTTIDFSRNQLSGDISMFFGTNKTTQTADFSRNNFTFNISDLVFPDTLTTLDLNHNKVFGSLPTMLTGLWLQHLNVSYNRLCGQIPQGGRLQNFEKTEYFHNRCLCGLPLSPCALP